MTEVQRRNFVKCLIANVATFFALVLRMTNIQAQMTKVQVGIGSSCGYRWFEVRPVTSRLGNGGDQSPTAWTLVTREHRIWTLVTGHGCGGWTLVITPQDRPSPPSIMPGLLQNSQRILTRFRTAVRTRKSNRFSGSAKYRVTCPSGH